MPQPLRTAALVGEICNAKIRGEACVTMVISSNVSVLACKLTVVQRRLYDEGLCSFSHRASASRARCCAGSFRVSSGTRRAPFSPILPGHSSSQGSFHQPRIQCFRPLLEPDVSTPLPPRRLAVCGEKIFKRESRRPVQAPICENVHSSSAFHGFLSRDAFEVVRKSNEQPCP